jgi:hypothetical protein
MHMNVATLFRAAVVLVLLTGVAAAGPLPLDPNGMGAPWQGTASFSGTTGANTLNAQVDYAVYAPGQFGTSAALGAPGHTPADPSGGADYVYAYEIFNGVPAGTVIDLNLSVGLASGAIPNGSTNITNDPGTPAGGVAPSLSQFIPGSDPEQAAKWSYTTGLAVGAHSDILIFTSPFPPQFFLSSMQGGHATIASSPLPSPTPEPATATLSIIGVVCLLVARHLRAATRQNRT